MYVAQPEVKPGCVLRRSNVRELETRGLVDSAAVSHRLLHADAVSGGFACASGHQLVGVVVGVVRHLSGIVH